MVSGEVGLREKTSGFFKPEEALKYGGSHCPTGDRPPFGRSDVHGEIEVELRLKDATKANVIVKNNSAKPLAIKMPATFSTVPVLRQGFGGQERDSGSTKNVRHN